MTARRGFILATTLLVMTLLTVMLVATFVLISAEFRTTNGSYSTSRSLDLAEAGLQSYYAFAHTLTSGSDSTSYTFPGGYASVVAKRLRDSVPSSDRAIWIVYSKGIDSTRSIIINGTGTRTVAQLAYLTPGVVRAGAAMVAVNGITMNGGGISSPIDGTNFNTSVTGCTQVGANGDTTGLRTFPGGLLPNASGPPKGSPKVDSTAATASALADSTHIDWTSLVAGQFTPDYYNQLPAGPYPNANYQTYYYPSSGVTIGANQYRGLLVVNGDVTLSSGSHWDGIIIAGGALQLPNGGNPSYTIHGMIITGLNVTLGQNVAKNQLQRGGTGLIRFDWCYTRSSMISLSYLVPIKGSFVDTWKTY
jgi:Tfp pilus assembly protein PilX